MIRICQTPNKSIEIDNSKHDSTGFAKYVFLTNRQQDLQMLNSTKLSFFWDTLYILARIREPFFSVFF